MEKFITVLTLAALAAQGETPPTTFWGNPKVFRCSPTVVGPDDTLVLSKRSAALRELAVRRPGNKVPHFLVVGLPPEEMKPLMSPDQLSATSEVRIRVAALNGLEWSSNASSEPIFTVPGTYEFWLSTNLESEEGAYVCRVRYQPRGKHANNSFKPKPLRGSVDDLNVAPSNEQ